MSATLRYDLGARATNYLLDEYPHILVPFRLQRTRRWAGVHCSYWKVVTFAIKLPSQVREAYALLQALKVLSHYPHSEGGCFTLWKKLHVSLGLPWNEYLGLPPEEKAFGKVLDADPGNLVAWSAYADWLTEQDNPRGELIAGWLGSRPIPVKYGIPVLARKQLGRS